MEGSMSAATTLSAPQDQIEALIKQVADENGLEVTSQLPSVSATVPGKVGDRSQVEEDNLTKRLAALRD
jgi:charged multivesicular body protein 1